MDTLHHLAQAAAVILLIELVVVLVIFAAVAGGLAFGLRLGRRKSAIGFEKVNAQIPLVRGQVHTGNEMARRPFVEANRLYETSKVRALQLRDRARAGAIQLRERAQSIWSPPPPPPPDSPEAYPAAPVSLETPGLPGETEIFHAQPMPPPGDTVPSVVEPTAPETTVIPGDAGMAELAALMEDATQRVPESTAEPAAEDGSPGDGPESTHPPAP
jgi:hypothetical protein